GGHGEGHSWRDGISDWRGSYWVCADQPVWGAHDGRVPARTEEAGEAGHGRVDNGSAEQPRRLAGAGCEHLRYFSGKRRINRFDRGAFRADEPGGISCDGG